MQQRGVVLAQQSTPTVTADGVVLPPDYLLGGAIALAIAFVMWLMKRELANNDRRTGRIEERQDHQSADVERLEDSIADLRASLPREYVHRDDWVRVSANLEAKLDAVHRRLDGILKER